MDLPAIVLGTEVADALRERVKKPLLRIGSDVFTRRQLARVDCFSFAAAANLSFLLNKHLKVADTRSVFYDVPPTMLALPRLGPFTLAVLGAAFEAKGLGGDAPLENYIRRHMGAGTKMVTFNTIKARDQKEEADERKRTRARKHARRNIAHGTRVARFEARAVAS